MISRYDFADALHLLFESKDAYVETSLYRMKSSTFIFDSRKLIYYFYRCANFLAVAANLEALKTKLSAFAINFSVVFSGIDIFDLAPLLNPAFLFSRFLEKYYYFKMIYKIISDNEIANHNYSISVINIYNRLANDSFVASIYQTRYQELMIGVMRRMGIDHLRALHSSDSHIADALRIGTASTRAVSQPTIFLFSEEKQAISEINLLEESCMVYDLNLLSEALNCSPGLLRRCLLGAFLYFQCNPSKRNELRLVAAMKKPFLEFSETHIQGNKDNLELLLSIITTLQDRVKSSDSDEQLCLRVAETFDLDSKEMIALLGLHKKSALTEEKPTSNHSKMNLPVLSPKAKDKSLKNFQLWASKNYLPSEIVRLFSSFSDYTTYFYFPKFECLEISFMYQMYYRDKIQFAASQISSELTLPKSVQSGKVNFFNEEVAHISFGPITDDIFPFIDSSETSKRTVTFQSELIAFFKQIRESQFNHHNLPNGPSVTQALKFVHLSLLRDLFYINPAAQSILIPGAAFIELGENEFQEEMIFLFELVRSNMIQTKMYRVLQARSRDHIKVISRNFFDMLVINAFSFDPFLVKFNFNYAGKSSFSRGTNSPHLSEHLNQIETIKETDENDDLSDSNEQIEEKLSEMKFSITILYKTTKSFMKEYLKFHEEKTNEDVHWILEQAFATRALGKVLFISRILTFVVTNYAIPEIFDYDLYQFRELYTIVNKSIQTLMRSYLFNYASKLGLAQNQEFIDKVISALPFQKSYSLDFGILLKVLLPKFLIYRTLEENNDPFASVFLAEFDLSKIRAKYAVTFDLTETLERGKRLFIKLFAFLQCMSLYGENAILSKFSQNLKRSSNLLKDFIAFMHRIHSPH